MKKEFFDEKNLPCIEKDKFKNNKLEHLGIVTKSNYIRNIILSFQKNMKIGPLEARWQQNNIFKQKDCKGPETRREKIDSLKLMYYKLKD